MKAKYGLHNRMRCELEEFGTQLLNIFVEMRKECRILHNVVHIIMNEAKGKHTKRSD